MHSVVKDYLGRSNGDLYTVCNAIDKTIRNATKNYNDARNRARDRPRHVHKAEPLFSEIVNETTPNAIDITAKQIEIAKSPSNSAGGCSGISTRTMGLPCWHSLKENLQEQRPVRLENVHLHWRFDKHIGPAPVPPSLPRLLAEEPAVVERTRGRPTAAS